MHLAQSLLPDRAIHWRDTIDSTMHEADRLANAGAPTGTVIGADEQTAGHGSFNRVWHSGHACHRMCSRRGYPTHCEHYTRPPLAQ